VAKNATQYNYLSHNQLERAAKQIARCTDASCIQDATRKFQELSLQQDIDAIVSCQADPGSCAASSKEVANTLANLNAIRDIADYASPDAREAVQSLINGNHEFQEMLATATTEHSVGAMVESLKTKWALSDAQAQDIADNLKIALAVGVGTAAGVVAYRRAVAGGGAKVAQKVLGLGEVDDFLALQSTNLNKKLGSKIGEGRLPYEASKTGVEQAKATVKLTLENATSVSPVIPSSTVRGNYDLVHVYSSKTNNTVSLRVLSGGRYEFDTLIPEKSSKF
jgi:hypothetical protein